MDIGNGEKGDMSGVTDTGKRTKETAAGYQAIGKSLEEDGYGSKDIGDKN